MACAFGQEARRLLAYDSAACTQPGVELGELLRLLGLSDGARPEVLKRVTHGRPGDIMGVYTEIPWETLCEDVSKLRITSPGAPAPPPSPRIDTVVTGEVAPPASDARTLQA